MCSGSAEGPCLVHTITGDLLRALEGPDHYQRARLISVSSEGHCIIYYERGRFCNFSINGKLLAQMEVNDSTRVSSHCDTSTLPLTCGSWSPHLHQGSCPGSAPLSRSAPEPLAPPLGRVRLSWRSVQLNLYLPLTASCVLCDILLLGHSPEQRRPQPGDRGGQRCGGGVAGL